jgi:hypothetical protein
MDKVGIERAYRIIKSLEDFSKEIKEEKLPLLQEALQRWSRKVFWGDLILFVFLAVILGALQLQFSLFDKVLGSQTGILATLAVTVMILFGIHLKVRRFFARKEANRWKEKDITISKAILHNTRWWYSMFGLNKRGWHNRTKAKLDQIMTQSREAIQKLNDQFVSPSGTDEKKKSIIE